MGVHTLWMASTNICGEVFARTIVCGSFSFGNPTKVVGEANREHCHCGVPSLHYAPGSSVREGVGIAHQRESMPVYQIMRRPSILILDLVLLTESNVSGRGERMWLSAC